MNEELKKKPVSGENLKFYDDYIQQQMTDKLGEKLDSSAISAWAKAPTKPSYTAAEVGAIPVSAESTFAKKSDLANVYRWKGSVQTYADLPTLTADDVGFVYDVVGEGGMNYGWTGTAWDPLGSAFQLDFLTNEEVLSILEGTT